MCIRSWRVNIVQGLRYSVPEDAPSHAITWLPPPGVPEEVPSHATTRLPHPGAPEDAPSHATAWLPRYSVATMPRRARGGLWQLRYTPVFNPKPSRNNPCPPEIISSQFRPHDMPQTRHQNHLTINPNSPQK